MRFRRTGTQLHRHTVVCFRPLGTLSRASDYRNAVRQTYMQSQASDVQEHYHPVVHASDYRNPVTNSQALLTTGTQSHIQALQTNRNTVTHSSASDVQGPSHTVMCFRRTRFNAVTQSQNHTLQTHRNSVTHQMHNIKRKLHKQNWNVRKRVVIPLTYALSIFVFANRFSIIHICVWGGFTLQVSVWLRVCANSHSICIKLRAMRSNAYPHTMHIFISDPSSCYITLHTTWLST